MIADKIYSTLSSAASLSSAVIRPIILSQSDPLPGITYHLSKSPDEVFEGESGYQTGELEINVYDKTLASANVLSDAVKSEMLLMVGVDIGIKIYKVRLTRQIDDYESDPVEYRVNMQFTINYSEG